MQGKSVIRGVGGLHYEGGGDYQQQVGPVSRRSWKGTRQLKEPCGGMKDLNHVCGALDEESRGHKLSGTTSDRSILSIAALGNVWFMLGI